MTAILAATSLAFVVAWYAGSLIEAMPRKLLKEAEQTPPIWMKLKLDVTTRLTFSVMVAGVWLGVFLRDMGHLRALMYGAAGSILVLLAFIDWRTRLLPDRLTYLLLWTGLVSGTQGWLPVPLRDAVYGAVAGYVGFCIFARVARYFGGQEAVGQGDVKLLAAIGVWVGPILLLPVILGSSVCALVVAIWLEKQRTNEPWRAVPFGPFLAASGIAVSVLAPELTSFMIA